MLDDDLLKNIRQSNKIINVHNNRPNNESSRPTSSVQIMVKKIALKVNCKILPFN